MKITSAIVMGKISGVHGLKGALKLYVYAEAPEAVFVKNKPITIEGARNDNTYMIEQLVSHGNGFLLFLNGVTTRTDAENLVGGEITIARDQLPDIEEDGAYYWHDLIGLTVKTDTGEVLGRIDHIIETGSNDVFSVRDGKREILVPGIESVIVSVDLEQGQMIACLPDGLAELNDG